MYEVKIIQEQIRHKGTENEYTSTETITITVKSVEEIEVIVGLFGRECEITIDYVKEGDTNDKDA